MFEVIASCIATFIFRLTEEMVVYSMMAQAVTSKILPPYRPPYETILLDFIRFLTVFGGHIYKY